MAGMVQVLQ